MIVETKILDAFLKSIFQFKWSKMHCSHYGWDISLGPLVISYLKEPILYLPDACIIVGSVFLSEPNDSSAKLHVLKCSLLASYQNFPRLTRVKARRTKTPSSVLICNTGNRGASIIAFGSWDRLFTKRKTHLSLSVYKIVITTHILLLLPIYFLLRKTFLMWHIF